MSLTIMHPSLEGKQLVRHANLFLPHYKVEENPSLKPKSLVRHVKPFQFMSCYKVEKSKSKDFELDDVYESLVDDVYVFKVALNQ